jgi:lipopolysaccharide/colanic/teichoic acid biosynthesis glycosyltransferase
MIEPFFTIKLPRWKRLIDLVASIMGLILFAPTFLLISLLVKSVSPGPVFFKQERIGYGGKKFSLWKFRTMKMNTSTYEHQQYLAKLINGEENSNNFDRPMCKLDDSNPDIIPFGKILRKSGLDELPQLINVVLGNMSLVGPRPPIPYEVSVYSDWHISRFNALPGLTGLWQVSGKNRLTFKEMIRLDIQYSKNLSFFNDVKILLKTPGAILSEFRTGH